MNQSIHFELRIHAIYGRSGSCDPLYPDAVEHALDAIQNALIGDGWREVAFDDPHDQGRVWVRVSDCSGFERIDFHLSA